MKNQQILNDALGSIRAEGLEPTIEAIQLVSFAIKDKISWQEGIERLKTKYIKIDVE